MSQPKFKSSHDHARRLLKPPHDNVAQPDASGLAAFSTTLPNVGLCRSNNPARRLIPSGHGHVLFFRCAARVDLLEPQFEVGSPTGDPDLPLPIPKDGEA